MVMVPVVVLFVVVLVMQVVTWSRVTSLRDDVAAIQRDLRDE